VIYLGSSLDTSKFLALFTHRIEGTCRQSQLSHYRRHL